MMVSLALAKLTSRKLLRITGPDCYPYLQSLLCNDLRHLYEPENIPPRKYASASQNVISSFMLNPQGRAICDMLVYRTPLTKSECTFTPPGKATEHDELLIECDAKLASGIANTLFGYRVRRKIAITTENDITTWCLYQSSVQEPEIDNPKPQELVNTNLIESNQEIICDELIVVNDPRLSSLGLRILSSGNFDQISKSLQSVIDVNIRKSTEREYILHRYSLGVGEGHLDHPESICLPLECNADLLNSVSFEKGCYLGQELTARIHYTGVVRKRLMPVVWEANATESLEAGRVPLLPGTDIIDETNGKKVGTLRKPIKNRALALLRHDMLTDSCRLIHEGTSARLTTYKPFWWDMKSD